MLVQEAGLVLIRLVDYCGLLLVGVGLVGFLSVSKGLVAFALFIVKHVLIFGVEGNT